MLAERQTLIQRNRRRRGQLLNLLPVTVMPAIDIDSTEGADEGFITPERHTLAKKAEKIARAPIRRIERRLTDPVSGAVAPENRDTAGVVAKPGHGGGQRAPVQGERRAKYQTGGNRTERGLDFCPGGSDGADGRDARYIREPLRIERRDPRAE